MICEFTDENFALPYHHLNSFAEAAFGLLKARHRNFLGVPSARKNLLLHPNEGHFSMPPLAAGRSRSGGIT
jgi:hypothetical protein